MIEPALLSLSRAVRSVIAGCRTAVAQSGVEIRGVDVGVLLAMRDLGPSRHPDLAAHLQRTTIKEVTGQLRRRGLAALSGYGRSSAIVLTGSGIAVCNTIGDHLNHRWQILNAARPQAEAILAVNVMRDFSGTSTFPHDGWGPHSSDWPAELTSIMAELICQLVGVTLARVDVPGFTEAPIRPMLLLRKGPCDTAQLARELGIGRPAVNIALTAPIRTGLIERSTDRSHDLKLTSAGIRVADTLAATSDELWDRISDRFGPYATSATTSLVSDLGLGAPASARHS